MRRGSSLIEKLLLGNMTEWDFAGKKTGEEAEAVIFLLLYYFLCEGRYADESATSGRSDWPWRCKDSVIS